MNDNANEASQSYSSVAYQPKGKRIRVIQQFVNTILEDDKFCEPPRQPFERPGDDIHLYDFIGAVDIKTDRRGKKSVQYHVKWKGYGINFMTWEPESHIFEEDLLELWSKYGRICATKKKDPQTLRLRMQQLHQCHPSEVHRADVQEMAQADHVTPPKSPETVETSYEQNVKRDGGSPGLDPSQNLKASMEVEGRGRGDPGPCTPLRLPMVDRQPTPPQQKAARLDEAHQNPLACVRRPEPLDMSQEPQKQDATSSHQSETNEVRPMEEVDTASVAGDNFLYHVHTSRDKAPKNGSHTRTKTGCLTCRRRKKKCDENRPSCFSCIRLKLPCQGYDSGPRRVEPVPIRVPATRQQFGAQDTTMLALPQLSESHERVSNHLLHSTFSSDCSGHLHGSRCLPRLAELYLPTLREDAGRGARSWELTVDGGRQGFPVRDSTLRPIQFSNVHSIPSCPSSSPSYLGFPQPIEPSVWIEPNQMAIEKMPQHH